MSTVNATDLKQQVYQRSANMTLKCDPYIFEKSHGNVAFIGDTVFKKLVVLLLAAKE